MNLFIELYTTWSPRPLIRGNSIVLVILYKVDVYFRLFISVVYLNIYTYFTGRNRWGGRDRELLIVYIRLIVLFISTDVTDEVNTSD